MFQKRKEMKLISKALEDLINGKEMEITLPNQDTLPAKVQHQLLRLSDVLRGTQEKAWKERNQIKELIAETAHQLRNPLANMESYLELLQGEEISREEQEMYLKALCVSEARIRFLTEGFIKMSRLENHVVQIKKEERDLTAMVLNSLLQVKGYAQEKQITFSVEAEEGIYVAHDANWLGEAVYNLLDNSVKYSGDRGRVEIKISKNEMFAQVAIRDFGIGIEADEINLIFQRFYRGKRAEKLPGFGLGLYLAREIVLQHGGFMKAREKEKGMEICIFLPV